MRVARPQGAPPLGNGIIEAVADRAHRGDDASRLDVLAEGERRVLTAVIGVMDQAGGRLAVPDGHRQGVEDDGQIPPAFPGRDGADLGHPEAIGRTDGAGREGASHPIGGQGRLPIRRRHPHPAAPAPLPGRSQLGVHARTAIGTTAGLMNGGDALAQPGVGLGPG